MFASISANAAGVASTDDFYELYDWLERNLTGGLAVGIALVAMLIGAGIGAMQQSALPMVGGVVVALFFAIGPSIIIDLIAGSIEISDITVAMFAPAEQASSVLEVVSAK